MAFGDFKRFGEALKKLQIHAQDRRGLFAACPPMTPSDMLLRFLDRGAPLATAIGTEKARSELIVAPMLLELTERAPQISFFSGTDFNVEPATGLVGTCDFMLSRSSEQHVLTAPVVALVEAKRDDIHEGLGQCLAEMVAAQLFNQREGNDIPAIYGVVTTGISWKFMRLVGQTLTLEMEEYLLSQPARILGVLLAMATGTAPVE